MAVDFGFRRIGIAVGEGAARVSTARKPLEASGTLAKDAEAIARLARAEEAALVIVGVPLENGEIGKQAKICLQLADRLREQELQVATQDEAGTTLAATADLAEEGWSAAQRKRLVDGESARRILERYWSEQG